MEKGTLDQIGDLLGLKKSRIYQLQESGVVVKICNGQYDLFLSAKNYIGYLKNLLETQWSKGT